MKKKMRLKKPQIKAQINLLLHIYKFFLFHIHMSIVKRK